METQRLVLRGFEERDALDLYGFTRSDRVGHPAGLSPHRNLEEARRAVRSMIEKKEAWAIVNRETGRVIGCVSLQPDAKRSIESARAIGYMIAEAFWGRGLAQEAVRAVVRHAFLGMGLDIVSAVCFPFNDRSRRVVEKCGFRFEGTLRMARRLYTGEVCDTDCFSITRDEFEALGSPPTAPFPSSPGRI